MNKIIVFVSILFSPAIVYADSNPVEDIFTNIYQTNAWQSRETVSGPGSELAVTKNMRLAVSRLINQFQIKSIADAPCGDFNWMRFIDLSACTYTGLDIVQELIEQNTRIYGNSTRTFKHLNVIQSTIDKVDLILCRDLLAHLSYNEIFEVLKNFKNSGSKYLLVTTNTRATINHNIPTGEWRLLNLEKAPFNFPKPILLIEEDVPFELERGKHLGLWRLEDIKID